MRKNIDTVLVFAVIIPAALLFWPFAVWNTGAAIGLRVVPSFAAQVLLFRTGKGKVIKVLPVLVATAFAVWGIYLYFTSLHWNNATFWGGLIADYVSPFVSCVVALIICILVKKQRISIS